MPVARQETPFEFEITEAEKIGLEGPLGELISEAFEEITVAISDEDSMSVIEDLREKYARLLLGYIGYSRQSYENRKREIDDPTVPKLDRKQIVEVAHTDGPGGTHVTTEITSPTSLSVFSYIVNEDGSCDFGAFAPKLATTIRKTGESYVFTFGKGTINSIRSEAYHGSIVDERIIAFPHRQLH